MYQIDRVRLTLVFGVIVGGVVIAWPDGFACYDLLFCVIPDYSIFFMDYKRLIPLFSHRARDADEFKFQGVVAC